MNFTVTESTNRYKNKIITIPNILSFFRICLIPLFVWLYFKNSPWATVVFIISGMTDVVDGYIARKFDMISDFGKAFDPIADKLTQVTVLVCLIWRFEFMRILVIILVIKETLAAIMNMITIKKTGLVIAAVWHGKANTVLLYATMFLHIVWPAIPGTVSMICVMVCIAMMILSSVLYTISDIKEIKNNKKS